MGIVRESSQFNHEGPADDGSRNQVRCEGKRPGADTGGGPVFDCHLDRLLRQRHGERQRQQFGGLAQQRGTECRGSFGRAGWDGTLEQEIKDSASLHPGQSIDSERGLAYSNRKHYLRLLGSYEYFEHGSRTIVSARHGIQRIFTRQLHKFLFEHAFAT